jgi:hypothetical protein
MKRANLIENPQEADVVHRLTFKLEREPRLAHLGGLLARGTEKGPPTPSQAPRPQREPYSFD